MGNVKLFEAKKVRTHWDSEKELWFFSIIDVIEALTGTDRPRKYWSDLKAKLLKEGSQLSEDIGQLKMSEYTALLRHTTLISRHFPMPK
jgi:DNA-damage-inducible protein D